MASAKLKKPAAAESPPPVSSQVVAHNLRRIMAESAITYEEVVAASTLDARTVRGIARGEQTAHARSLRKLADGLGVEVDQLLAPPNGLSQAAFDAATNPAVQRAREAHPEVFRDWAPGDYAELASRFAVGGELTEHGAIEQAQRLNQHRAVLRRARVVLESNHADLLARLIDLLYERVRLDR